MDEILKIIGALSPLIIGIGIPYINHRNKVRDEKNKEEIRIRDEKTNIDNSRREQLFLEELKGIGANVGCVIIEQEEMKAMLVTHIAENDFNIQYKNVFQRQMREKIEFGEFNKEYISVISYWLNEIEKFGLKFYYSEYRKNKDSGNLKTFLNIYIDDVLCNFSKVVDLNIKGLKVMPDKKTKVFFSDFLNGTKINTKLYVLIEILVRNGLTPEKTVELFDNYINDWYKLFLTNIRVWEHLVIYESKDKFD